MDNTELLHLKAQCLCDLRTYLRTPTVRAELEGIDPRLWQYVTDATSPLEHFVLTLDDEGTEIEDCIAGLYELLGIRKVLRLLNTYRFNTQRARQWLLAQEGVWQQDERGRWQHQRGGLKFDTPRGAQHVRLMNFQAWITCMALGFETDVCMQRKEDGSPLLHSEWVDSDGMVWDTRRLCREIHLFITRKAGKTEYGVSLDFAEMSIMGDMNAQVTIVGNSKDSAVGIAYDKAKQYAWQVDPSSVNKLGGKLLKVGATGMEFVAGCKRTASLAAFAAGGKPKDGWNSEWVHADEHGQAAYVNDHSDMENTVQVFVGSGGVRRERMLLHTTTAGLVTTGPYKELLEKVQQFLLDEMQIPLGTAQKTTEDHWFAFLAQLDPWDYDGNLDSLNHEHLWRRVNPAFGITVQPTWYRERLHEAATKNEDVRKEVLTKDFNIWQSERIIKWIQPEEIRALQPASDAAIKTIDDLDPDDGWQVFIGQDFSEGNDLCGQSYLCVREMEDGGMEFFADMDAWIAEEMLEVHPNSELYKAFINAGYLHTSPGKTIDEMLVVNRNIEIAQRLPIVQWGYDSYDAMRFVNAIGAWLKATFDINPEDMMRPVSQTYATYNSPVQNLEYMVRSNPPHIRFSANPMWPWQFGAVSLEEDKYENKKPVKAQRGGSGKVDNVQCLCSALKMYDDYIQSYNNDKD